ncbi:MAG: HEAT repeat domain-containing protein [Deltaproteobacteria bacterium]
MRRFAAALLATAIAACHPGGRGDLDAPDPARRAAAVERWTDARDGQQLSALLVAQMDPHPGVRAAAARALGTRGGTRSLEPLAAMLGDSDPEVVSSAARALVALRPDRSPADAASAALMSEAAGQALAQAYGRSDSRGRVEIAQAMRAVGASLRDAVEAESRLLWERNRRALESGTVAGRTGAAEELGRSGRAEAVKILVPLLEGAGTDPRIAGAAARGLGSSGDAAALAPLEAALAGTPASLAESAAWALGSLGLPQAADALIEAGTSAPARVAIVAVAALDALPQAPGVAIGLCEVALRSRDPDSARAAAAASATRAADCPERPLAQRIAKGGTDTLAALAALGSMGLPPDRVKLPADKATNLVTSSRDALVRAAAARSLGEIAYPGALVPLQRRLAILGDTGDLDERIEYRVALARIAPLSAASVVAPLVASAEPRVRGAATRALIPGRVPGALPLLGRLATDEDASVRIAAYEALAPAGAQAVPMLAAALRAHADDPEEADAVVRALGATGDPSVVPMLSPLLAGPLASAAARALGRLGAPEGGAVLLATLQTGATRGRLDAVESLALLGTQDAGEVLHAELLADRPAIRAAAARAIGKIRYEPAAGRLEALRSDYYAEVRRAALEALARLPTRSPQKP